MPSEYGANAIVSGTFQVSGTTFNINADEIDIGSGDDDILLDETTLTIDATNNRVGIGTESPDQQLHVTNNVLIDGSLSFEDVVVAELSIPGIDLQTDTNAFRFNCPYQLTVEGLDLYLDQHTTSGNVTVTVTNTTDSNTMITLSITGTNTSASTTTVSNATADEGDIITFAITATPANAQGLRVNLLFRRRLA